MSPTKRKEAPTQPAELYRQTPRQTTANANNSSTPFDTRLLQNDRLGTLVSQLAETMTKAPSWEDFVHSFRGTSYLSSRLDELDHPATPLLRQWKDEGVPVLTSSTSWTAEQKDDSVSRGCHHSANQHAEFLREEMANNIENKFWMVLPYDLVRDQPNLMLSPAAVKEERERRPHTPVRPLMGLWMAIY